MKIEDFDMLAALLKQRSGLMLTKDKAYLLETRLMPVARKHGMKDLEHLCCEVRMRKTPKLLTDITEAMTTNESLFFRDSKPFDQFKNVLLPQVLINRAASKKIRIWSTACSSGQEPYSLAMLLKEEQAKLVGWRIEILATDISEEILDKARTGIYTQFEVQRGLPIQMLVKHFSKNGDKWHIDPSLRSMVAFKPFNLLEHPRRFGQFDIVFCRNVLIYFDQPTKASVLSNISDVMANDGVLYLGGAETVLGVTDKFKPVPNMRGMYQHANEPPAIKVA